MKKILFISIGILIILAGLITGYLVNPKEEQKISNYRLVSETALENTIIDDCIDEAFELESALVASTEIKVSPNAVLLIKKHYEECGHTTKEYVEAPISVVNKTKEEVQEEYKDWEIESFSEKDITIIKDFKGICNEHFILKEKDGFIGIYILDDAGKETLHEITTISTEYLTEEDLLNIKEGIKVNGKEELNATLEDFE